MMVLWVAAGGAIGAAGRYLVGGQMIRLMGPNLPWGTFTVNITGSFLMGLLVGLLALRFNISPELRAFLTVGVLGGFTTFSAFALDVSVMFERKDQAMAGFYIAGSVGLSVAALFVGLALARVLAS